MWNSLLKMWTLKHRGFEKLISIQSKRSQSSSPADVYHNVKHPCLLPHLHTEAGLVEEATRHAGSSVGLSTPLNNNNRSQRIGKLR